MTKASTFRILPLARTAARHRRALLCPLRTVLRHLSALVCHVRASLRRSRALFRRSRAGGNPYNLSHPHNTFWTTLPIAACAILCASTAAHAAQSETLDYAHDANGNVTTRTTGQGTTNFTYDKLDRVDIESGLTGNRDHNYTPNDGALKTNNAAQSPLTYTPNSDRIATVNGQTWTLDAKGQLTQNDQFKFVWNTLGQLTELRRKSDNALIATYFYDYRSLRTRKVTTAIAPQGVGTIFYYYDESNQLVSEIDQNDKPVMTYLWGDGRLYGAVVHQPTRQVYAIQTDRLGSPYQILRMDGTVVWRWEADAYGTTPPIEDVDQNGTKLTFNLRFPGQYYDRESGLHYNHHRYYDPRIGAYISNDPIGLAGGMNTYLYANAAPTMYRDFSGLKVTLMSRKVQSSLTKIIAARHAWFLLEPNNLGQVQCLLKRAGFHNVLFPMWIGAYSIDGMLTAAPNAPSDDPANEESSRLSRELTPPRGSVCTAECGLVSEDSQFIASLLIGAATYNKNLLPYNPVPLVGDGYNSNSFAQGLLNSIGYDGNLDIGNTVGSGKPVPKSHFTH